MENKSKLLTDLNTRMAKKYSKPEEEKPVEKQPEVKALRKVPTPAPTENIISQDRLQEAIIWSEILGKPLSKRRKRR